MSTFGHLLTGRYKLSIVDNNDNVIWEQPEYKKNLILNSGLNMVADAPYSSLTKYGVAGTGTRENYFTSSNSRIVQTGTTILLYPNGSDITSFLEPRTGYANILQEGDVIKYTNGSGSVTEVMISGNILSGSATTYTSLDIPEPGDTFTIWKTSQTSLQTETKRAGQFISDTLYYTPNDGCGTFYNGNVATLKRTYTFASETSDKVYSEVGTAWGTTGDLFNRIRVKPEIEVGANQRLRLTYELDLTVQPSSSVYVSNAQINGWPISPATNTNLTQSLQSFIITPVLSTGLNNSATNTTAMEPHSTFGFGANYCAISNVRGISAFGSSVERTGGSYAVSGLVKGNYVANTFYVYKYVTFDTTTFNRTDISNLSIQQGNPTVNAQVYVLEFEQTQSKFNTQDLSFVFKYSWGRTLE